MKVSIVVPVHNVEKYLPEALESVIKQTYTDWELILVENRSRDRSYEVCLSYAEKYPDMATKATRATSIAILVLSITDGSTPLSLKKFLCPIPFKGPD